jgi:hypothetical protein
MGGTGRHTAEGRQRLAERSRRLEACKQTQASWQAGTGMQEEKQAWEVGRHTGMQSRLAEKKAGMHAGKNKQRSRAWPADRQARTDQKRHLGKQESRQRHLCKILQVKTTRHM